MDFIENNVLSTGAKTIYTTFQIAKAVVDIVRDFFRNPFGTLVSIFMGIVGIIGDAIQWVANTIQTDESNKVKYSYDELSDPNIDTDNKNKYTNVGEYEEGAKVIKGVDLSYDENENGYPDFVQETEIPVMVGDLYNIAVGHIDFFDINFLNGQKETKGDGTLKHEDDSKWTIMRNFAAVFIRISIYISSMILLMSLIWYGIKIVRNSLGNPMARAKAKEGLERFEKSLLMLISSILIMGLCIFGSRAMVAGIEEESYELPIRVNVEDVYSFSTTITGYVRYLSLTIDVSEWMQKSVYTILYIILAIVNLVFVILMLARTFLVLFLAILGPVIAALNVFRNRNISEIWKLGKALYFSNCWRADCAYLRMQTIISNGMIFKGGSCE